MEAGRRGGPEGEPSGGADGADQQAAGAWEEQCCRSRHWERAEEAAGWRRWRCSGDPRLRALSPVSPLRISPQPSHWFSMVVRKCCGLVCELQTLSSSKVISHMPTTKMHIYWLREQQHNSDDSANIYLQGPEGMLMLRRHLSYLQKERTRPSSCLVAVSSFDSFVQQRGDLAFFMSRAKRKD
ncbi:hypothetical protein ACQJBY_015448 [Aegilops geniculata]